MRACCLADRYNVTEAHVSCQGGGPQVDEDTLGDVGEAEEVRNQRDGTKVHQTGVDHLFDWGEAEDEVRGRTQNAGGGGGSCSQTTPGRPEIDTED